MIIFEWAVLCCKNGFVWFHLNRNQPLMFISLLPSLLRLKKKILLQQNLLSYPSKIYKRLFLWLNLDRYKRATTSSTLMTPFALRLIFPFPILMEVTKLIGRNLSNSGLQNALEILLLEMRYHNGFCIVRFCKTLENEQICS